LFRALLFGFFSIVRDDEEEDRLEGGDIRNPVSALSLGLTFSTLEASDDAFKLIYGFLAFPFFPTAGGFALSPVRRLKKLLFFVLRLNSPSSSELSYTVISLLLFDDSNSNFLALVADER